MERDDNHEPELTPEQIAADEAFMQRIRDRIDDKEFYGALLLLHNRLDAADILDMLPSPRAPTPIAREDFLLGVKGLWLEGRIETMRGIVLYNKMAQTLPEINGIGYKRLNIGNTTLSAADLDDIPIETLPKLQKFAIRGSFKMATVTVSYDTYNDIRVTVEFPKAPGAEKPLAYNSKQLPRGRLTTEENLVALYVLETAYLNMFDPKRQNP